MSENESIDLAVGAMRPGERAVPLPERADARLVFIGRVRTPWTTPEDCPRHGRSDGPVCRIVLHPLWQEALEGLAAQSRIEVIYWMHRARRDLVTQSPRRNGRTTGTFALRSPIRPNPIATALVDLLEIDGNMLFVRGLDCVDGTPLLDLKPERYAYTTRRDPSDEQRGHPHDAT